MVTKLRDGVQPAEWLPHRGCITAWPEHVYAWGEPLQQAQVEFAFFLETLCRVGQERVHLLCDSQSPVRNQLAQLQPRLEFVDIPYGDVWLRDTAPIWVGPGEQTRRFRFNGWGGKYQYPHDDLLAERLAAHFGVPCSEVPLVCEGGALESDGAGTYLTTRSCLLNTNRNPGLSEVQAEACLREAFGAERVIWLDEGLAYDHTDGHIDNIARFVAPGQVLCMAPNGPQDPNQGVLDAIYRVLTMAHDASGRPLTVHRIKSPGRVESADQEPLAASYMNFYLTQAAVLVPTYGVAADEEALRTLRGLFPRRVVQGIPSRAILTGGGSLHCVTQQIPLAESRPVDMAEES